MFLHVRDFADTKKLKKTKVFTCVNFLCAANIGNNEPAPALVPTSITIIVIQR